MRQLIQINTFLQTFIYFTEYWAIEMRSLQVRIENKLA